MKHLPLIVISASLVALGVMVGAATGHGPSKATVMVHSQAPDADCIEFPSQQHIDVSICTVKDQTFVSVYSPKHPWQVFALQTTEQRAKATAATPAAPPAPAPAGSGSGSGSGSGK